MATLPEPEDLIERAAEAERYRVLSEAFCKLSSLHDSISELPLLLLKYRHFLLSLRSLKCRNVIVGTDSSFTAVGYLERRVVDTHRNRIFLDRLLAV